MAEPVKITIPAAVAAYIRPDVPLPERLRGAGGEVDLSPRDLLLLLFCLGKDADLEVQQRSRLTLQQLPDELFDCLVDWSDPHPAILHTIALICGERTSVRRLLLSHPALAEVTKTALNRLTAAEDAVAEDVVSTGAVDSEVSSDENEVSPEEEETSESDDELLDEDGEEFLSKYKLAQVMGIGEKIKMALTGDKEWRKILIKDSNKLVSSGVLKNPRITEPEVLTVLKSGAQNDEIMRLICANKEWVKNYQIRKALIENPKTPLPSALRFLSTMNEKDVANYAKSRNISSVIATQAKRMLLNKKR